MKLHTIKRTICLALLGFAASAGRAEDIDIYVGMDQLNGAPANVLIIMDNTANFASTAEKVTDVDGVTEVTNAKAEAAAMKVALEALPENALNVGVMLFGGPRSDIASSDISEGSDTGANNATGGYPIYAIKPVNATTRPTLTALLNNIRDGVSGSDNTKYKGPSSISYADLLNSAFRYFNGLKVFNDLDGQGDFRDYSGNTEPVLTGVTARKDLGDAYLGYSDADKKTYKKPVDANSGCARNVIIFVGNSTPSADNNWDDLKSRIRKAGEGIGKTPQTTGIPEAESLKLFAPYWTKFMATYGVKSTVQDANGNDTWNQITTYTVDVCNAGCDGVNDNNVDEQQRRLLKSMAAEGGGKYYKAKNVNELTDNFKSIFSEIQAVNSAFASATLPISVNTQGTFENQVYIGVFRPDANYGPRWKGNLKGYKFGRYCDANENGVVDFVANISNFIPAALSSTQQPTADDERIGESVTGYVCKSTKTSGKTLDVQLYLADKYGYPGIDQKLNTGFFDQSATSFWTVDSGTFWAFDAALTGNTKDIPDGPAVERGGAAQQVRLKWADPVIDSRKLYTCLSCATGTDLVAAANEFKSTTAGVGSYAAIQRPTTVNRTISSITRTGNVATASFSGSDMAAGNVVTIDSSISPAAYAGSHTISTINNATSPKTFTYAVTETPLQSTTASVSPITQVWDTAIPSTITLSGATISGNTVQVTASVAMTSAKTGLATTDTVKVENATQSFLNSNSAAVTINSVSGTNAFDYKRVLTVSAYDYASRASPTAGATAKAASTTGGLAGATSISIDKAYYVVSSQMVVMRLASAINNNGSYASNNYVRITGGGWPYTQFGQTYSDWTISDKGSACDSSIPNSDKNNWFCFSLPTTGLYITPDSASPNINVSFSGTPSYPVTLTRTAGSTTVTAKITVPAGGHALSGLSSVRISGSQGTTGVDSYNSKDLGGGAYLDWTVGSDGITSNTDDTFTMTIGAGQPVTSLGPATPATLGATPYAVPNTAGPTTSDLFIWLRGKDLVDENRNADTADARASIHGDVLHSRPAVVNYGSAGLYAFYGSNDAYLRGVKVGPDDSSDANRGREAWAFIPEEFLVYSKLSRQYMESPPVRYPNSACSASDPPSARDYFWDGPVAVYQSPTLVYYTSDINVTKTTETEAQEANCVSKGTCYKRPKFTWLYAGMRRGGNVMYALDISNPAQPKFMWKVSPSVTGYEKLGQTWSEPKFVQLKHKASSACLSAAGTDADAIKACGETLALAFGGGYDAATDDLPAGAARAEAASAYGVYVVKASDGTLIKHLMPSGATKRSSPADVTPIDTDGDGYLNRIYAVDTGAQIMRFDANPTLELTDSSYWSSYLVAQLGDKDGVAGGADDRKFMQQPAVVPYIRDGAKGYNILVGSGNREKPIANKKPYSTLSETSRKDSKNGGSMVLGCTAPGYYGSGTEYFGAQIEDRFYAVFDTDAAPTSTLTCTASSCSSLQQVNSSPTSLTKFEFSSGKKGWFIDLNYNPYNPTAFNGWEEKMVNAPRMEQGIVYFATNTPQKGDTDKGVCSNLGVARAYAIDPFTGLPAFNRDGSTADGKASFTAVDYAAKVAGGGLPPSVTAGTVKIGEEFYRASIGTGGTKEESKSSQEGERTDFQVSSKRTRVYWLYGAD